MNNSKSNTKNNNKSLFENKITTKHLLGKRNGKIGVLLKCNKKIKKQKKKFDIAMNQNINEITKYLKDKHLIKIGSTAPDELKKVMYEQAMLTGNVKNINKNNIMHNFINDKQAV